VNAHGDERVNRDVTVAELLELADVLGRDAVDPHGDEVIHGDVLAAESLETRTNSGVAPWILMETRPSVGMWS
jgi:hypothetical protein